MCACGNIKKKVKTVREIKGSDTKLADLQNIPTLYIFDGDTLSDPKRKKIRENLIKRYSNKADNIYTLSKNMIENYLLNSKSIKKAYPKIKHSKDDIKKIIERNIKKSNRKNTMNYILSPGGIGSYNKHRAKRIAQYFDIEDIDEEIKHLFSNIEKYAR